MIWYLVTIAFAAASISYTVGCSSIFLPMRDWLGPKNPKLDQFINCPWCIAHWIVLFLLGITEIIHEGYKFTFKSHCVRLTEWYIFDFILTWFVIMMIVGIAHFFIGNAYNGRESSFFRAKEWTQLNSKKSCSKKI